MPALIHENGTVVPQIPTRVIHSQAIFGQSQNLPLDHVSVSLELYKRLFLDNDTITPKHASIKILGETKTKFQVFLIDLNHNLTGSVVEFINMTSLIKYKNQITLDSCLIVGVPEPLRLSHLILSFPPEMYDLVIQVPKSNLYGVLTGDSDKKLFRQGDIVRNLNGFVVQCEPFDQGYIDPDTKITITKSQKAKASPRPFEVTNDDILSNIEFNFKEKLAFDEEFKSSVEFKVKTLQNQNHICSPAPLAKDDNEIFAFAKINELSKIGCFSGDLVEIVLENGSSRCVKIFGFKEPNDYEVSTIYISPILLINLNQPNTIKIQLSSLAIPTAKSVTIARVSSPITLNRTYQHLFLSNLKTHFEKANRVIHKGQIIPIPIDTILATSLSSIENGISEIIPEGNCDLIAWFKVTDIDDGTDTDSQYLIDSSVTKMTQSGTVTESPPDNSLEYYEYLGINRFFKFNTDTGCFKYAETFRKLIQTSQGRNLKTSILLHSQARGIGKSSLLSYMAIESGIQFVELNCFEVLVPGSDMKTIGTIRGKLDRIVSSCNSPMILFKHIEALVAQKDQQRSNKPETLILKIAELIDEYLDQGAIIIASTNDIDNLSDKVRNKFKFEVELTVPSQSERLEIFKFYLQDLKDSNYQYTMRQDVSLNSLALQSAGLTPKDIVSIINSAKNFSLEDLEDSAEEHSIPLRHMYYMNGGSISLTPDCFERAINDARNKFSDSIGAPKIPNVKWEDVGGLDLVKDEILDTIEMPLKHPTLFSNGLKKRSGILFYGPPGTGKTLLAKAIATNFSLNFFSVKGPELLNMYIGESEANVRKVFQKARDSKPCVVFFDELDSVAPKRGNQGDSGGVMDRIVSQLLAELDGMSSSGGDGVFVVGATNRPDLLDDALLRPGRFDKMLYLGISDTDEKQYKILQALTRKFNLDPDLDLMKIAQSCPFNFTGADFYALCSDSILNSMIRLSGEIDDRINKLNKELGHEINTRIFFEKYSTPEDTNVVVNEADFIKALDALSPSVSQEELNHYLNIKKLFTKS